MTHELILRSEFVQATKNLSDVELSTEIKTVGESAKSQSKEIQAVQFLDFGKKVPESVIEYIANKFVMPKTAIRTVEPSYNSKTGEQLDDKVFWTVPDVRNISFERFLGRTTDGQIYLDSLYSGKKLEMSRTQFENITKVIKTAEKSHSKHSSDVKLVQAFESSKKLFRSEMYLSLTKLKLKVLKNEELSRKGSEVNAAAKRIADMQKSFAKFDSEKISKQLGTFHHE